MNTTRYFSRDGGPPFAVADGDDIPDELDGCDEVSGADMDATEQAHRQALAAFAQAEAERVRALDVDKHRHRRSTHRQDRPRDHHPSIARLV